MGDNFMRNISKAALNDILNKQSQQKLANKAKQKIAHKLEMYKYPSYQGSSEKGRVANCCHASIRFSI